MAAQELSLFSYEILGLVGRGGAGAHDLLRMARDGRMLDWAGESQYYTEPKRLAKLGYLEARKEPGKTRERTVYSLTDKGIDALREYARTPVAFTPLKSEPLVRLLICDLVGEEVTRESMATLRDDVADIAAAAGRRRAAGRARSRTARSTCCCRSASCAGSSSCIWSWSTRSSASLPQRPVGPPIAPRWPTLLVLSDGRWVPRACRRLDAGRALPESPGRSPEPGRGRTLSGSRPRSLGAGSPARPASPTCRRPGGRHGLPH